MTDIPHQKPSREEEKEDEDEDENEDEDEDEEEQYKTITENHYDPHRWPNSKKYRILFLVALPTFLTPLSDIPLYPAILEIREEFQAATIIANSLLGTFIVSRGVAPIFWSSYSDQLETRKKVYLASLILYTLSNVLCGISTNMVELIVFRTLQSIGISAALTLGGGIVGDLFIPFERGKAYSIYLIGYFAAIAAGPFIGDLITRTLGWRWIFYILAISGGVTLLLITSFLPETFRPSGEKLPSPKPHKIQIVRELNPKSPSEESKSFVTRKPYNPLSPLKLLLKLNVLLSILSKSLAYLIIYTQGVLITRLFSLYYELSSLHVGFILIGPPIVYFIGNFIAGIYSDYLVKRERGIEMNRVKEERKKEIRNHKKSEIKQEIEERDIIYRFPIMRIKVAFYSSLLVPFLIAIFGILIRNRIHIAAPLIFLFLADIGLQGQINSISTYLIDAYPGNSASALALSDFVSYLLIAIAVESAKSLGISVGPGWAFFIIALFSILSIISLIIVLNYDEKWRDVNT